MNIHNNNYTPHSLRHGSATHDFCNGIEIETILIRGRWVSAKSARTYIQSGRSLAIQTNLPQSLPQLPNYEPDFVRKFIQQFIAIDKDTRYR